VDTIAVQPDGKILVGGLFTKLTGQTRNHIGRLHPDGTVDTEFNPNSDGEVYCFALQPDGKIIVAGLFNTIAGEPRENIARLNPDGTLDKEFNPGADDWVFSIALQTDGKIVVGGVFYELGGQPRTFIGRLHPDGTVDEEINDLDANYDIFALALQADGKIVVGGLFDKLGGQWRSGLARLSSSHIARQRLEINSRGTAALWHRSGAGPEVHEVSFDLSADGTNFTRLGSGTRIAQGWQLSGLSLPSGENFYLRARGRTMGGEFTSSSGLLESVAWFYRMIPPQITRVGKGGAGVFQFAFTNTSAQSFTVLASSDVNSPVATWEVLGAPVPVGGGLYQFSDPASTNFPRRFYQLRSP
jgi:uncharacterized delta-60 repeat protein